MDERIYLELIEALSIPLALLLIILHRMVVGKSIGTKTIHFLTVATLPPLILVLAFENLLDKTTIAVLLGSLVGFLFSKATECERRKDVDCLD